MQYRRVNTATGELDGTFERFGSGVRIGREVVPLANLEARSIFPQMEPEYDFETQITGPFYFDAEKKQVTKRVFDFAQGIAANWKARDFVQVGETWELYRTIRIRVRWVDTLTGGPLESKANDMLKSGSPFFRTDANGNQNNAEGMFTELYLNWIAEADKTAMQAYCAVYEGCEFLEYQNL